MRKYPRKIRAGQAAQTGRLPPDLEAACVAVAKLYAEKDTCGFWEEGRVYAYEGDTLCGYADIREEGYVGIAEPEEDAGQG